MKNFYQVENGDTLYYYNDQKNEWDELTVLDVKHTSEFYDIKIVAKFDHLYDKKNAKFEAYSRLSRNDMFFAEKEERDKEIERVKYEKEKKKEAYRKEVSESGQIPCE